MKTEIASDSTQHHAVSHGAPVRAQNTLIAKLLSDQIRYNAKHRRQVETFAHPRAREGMRKVIRICNNRLIRKSFCTVSSCSVAFASRGWSDLQRRLVVSQVQLGGTVAVAVAEMVKVAGDSTYLVATKSSNTAALLMPVQVLIRVAMVIMALPLNFAPIST